MLTEERVREIPTAFDPDYASDPVCNAAGDGHQVKRGDYLTEGDVAQLATDWLRFHAERVATGAEGTSFAWPEHCAAITADRDALRQQNAALRAMVEEAVVALNERCNDWERDEVVGAFRGRLAALGET